LLGGALELGNLTKTEETTAPLQEQVKNLFPQAGSSPSEPSLPPTGRTEQGAQQQPSGKLNDLAQKDPELSAALTEEREKAVTILTTKYKMDKQEAANLVQQWNPESQGGAQTEQKANEAATAVTKGLASGALWGFIALALGLIFAAWGGWAGSASLLRNVEVVQTAAPAR
jgi:hypothetical protein